MTTPDTLELDGRRFVRTRWALPEPSAIAHYREAVPVASRHAIQRADGTFEVIHTDRFNPTASPLHAVLHLASDTPFAPYLWGAGLLLLSVRAARGASDPAR